MNKQKQKFTRILSLGLLVMLTALPISTFAQTSEGNPSQNTTPATYTPLEPLPCIATSGVSCPGGVYPANTAVNFQSYIQNLFNLIIALGASSAVFMIVYGGFELVTTDSWMGRDAGKKKMTNALIGLLLVLTSYMILKTIDPRLVAIPSTLVTPLNINYTSTGLSFADQIAQNAQDYHVNLTNFQNNITAAQAQVQTAQQQEASTYQQIANGYSEIIPGLADSDGNVSNQAIDNLCQPANLAAQNDSNLTTLCLGLTQTQQSLITAQSTETLNQAMAGMRISATACDYADAACLANQAAAANISNIYAQFAGQLQTNDLKAFTAYDQYTQEVNNIDQDFTKLGGVSDSGTIADAQFRLGQLNNAVAAYAALPNPDKQTLADMQAGQQKLAASISSLANPQPCLTPVTGCH